MFKVVYRIGYDHLDDGHAKLGTKITETVEAYSFGKAEEVIFAKTIHDEEWNSDGKLVVRVESIERVN